MRMEPNSVWTIFIRPNPDQTVDSLPIRLKRVYNNSNLNQLLPIWSQYNPSEPLQLEMWSAAGGALQLGMLEVYLAIEDVGEIGEYMNYTPVYDVERVQARILKTPSHYTNFDSMASWVNWFNSVSDIFFDYAEIEDLPF